MSNLIDHARRELLAAGWFSKDGMYGGMVGEAVMDLIRVFSGQDHSGMSANLVLGLFGTVGDFKPLGPLTGADSEWVEVGDEGGVPLYQNNRCSRVFKCGGVAYDIEGKIFEEKTAGAPVRYMNKDSRVVVTFPYTPKTEIVPR